MTRKPTVNLAVYNDLRERGYTQESIVEACGWSMSQLRTCMKRFWPEETEDVDGEVDFDKLVPSRKKKVEIDMGKVMEKYMAGVAIKDIAKEMGIAYSTLWCRIDAIVSSKERFDH